MFKHKDVASRVNNSWPANELVEMSWTFELFILGYLSVEGAVLQISWFLIKYAEYGLSAVMAAGRPARCGPQGPQFHCKDTQSRPESLQQ